MSQKWTVHPAGVEAVDAAVVLAQAPIAVGAKTLEATTATASHGASSSLVDGALDAFFEAVAPLLKAAELRIPAAREGLRGTAQAVIDGDDEIASGIDDAQAGAVDLPVSGYLRR